MDKLKLGGEDILANSVIFALVWGIHRWSPHWNK